jgi:hypothetical protein
MTTLERISVVVSLCIIIAVCSTIVYYSNFDPNRITSSGWWTNNTVTHFVSYNITGKQFVPAVYQQEDSYHDGCYVTVVESPDRYYLFTPNGTFNVDAQTFGSLNIGDFYNHTWTTCDYWWTATYGNGTSITTPSGEPR